MSFRPEPTTFAVVDLLPRKQKNCHFDRSRSRFCEQPSGEIRFSTSSVSQLKNPKGRSD
jgi:hypothetical protein